MGKPYVFVVQRAAPPAIKAQLERWGLSQEKHPVLWEHLYDCGLGHAMGQGTRSLDELQQMVSTPIDCSWMTPQFSEQLAKDYEAHYRNDAAALGEADNHLIDELGRIGVAAALPELQSQGTSAVRKLENTMPLELEILKKTANLLAQSRLARRLGLKNPAKPESLEKEESPTRK